MQDPALKIGMHLKNAENDEEYRIIFLTPDVAVTCLMNIEKLVLESYPVLPLLKMLALDKLVVIAEENFIVDIDKLDESRKENFLKYREIMDRVTQSYGPTFMNLSGKKCKPVIEKILKQYSISNVTFWKKVRKYLQSGMQEKSLLDGRMFSERGVTHYSNKPGRKRESGDTGKLLDDTDFKNFRKYADLYLNNKSTSIESAFVDLTSDCYKERQIHDDGSITYVDMSENDKPSYNQTCK